MLPKRKTHWWLGLIFLIIVLLMAIFLFVLIIIAVDGGLKLTDGERGGFIGFTGSIIGGALTLVGVKWTLNKQNEGNVEIRKQEEEKTILSLRPYLRTISVQFDKDQPYNNLNFANDTNGNIVLGTCYFIIENVGLGTAVDINFPYLSHFERNNERSNLTLLISEKQYVNLSADFQGRSSWGNELGLTVAYSDLLGNEYSQYIYVSIGNIDKYGFKFMSVTHTSPPKLETTD